MVEGAVASYVDVHIYWHTVEGVALCAISRVRTIQNFLYNKSVTSHLEYIENALKIGT